MKITILGAGHVGATTAQKLAERETAREIVLVDIVDGVPQGKALDIWESAPLTQSDTRVVGANSYEETAGSDLVIITAGLPRRPGLSRDELMHKNAAIVADVTEKVTALSPDTILLVVTNPLSVMTQVAGQKSGLPPQRVLGMAGLLDSARFRAFIALELNVSVRDVQALTLGGHGELMVPLPRFATVGGIPITELLGPEAIERIIRRTREGDVEIINYLKTGSAFYAPASAAVDMAESILRDQKRILPCTAYLNGQYGLSNLFIGVPVRLGRGGVEEVIELKLNDDESAALKNAADIIIQKCGKLQL